MSTSEEKRRKIYAQREEMLQAIQDHILPILIKYKMNQQYLYFLIDRDGHDQIYTNISQEQLPNAVKLMFLEFGFGTPKTAGVSEHLLLPPKVKNEEA